MPRNGGSTTDIEAWRVLERNGKSYPLERLEHIDGALYYATPIASSANFNYHERWLLPEHGWSLSRFRFIGRPSQGLDWYIETDTIEVKGNLWTVRDCYLDVAVFEGSHYEVWDADELAEGLTAGEISIEEAAKALESLNRLCRLLTKNGYSGAALLAELAPGLPR